MKRKRKYLFDITDYKRFFFFFSINFKLLSLRMNTYALTLLISEEYSYLPLADISLFAGKSYHHYGVQLAL